MHATHDGWLTIREAAEAMGLSPDSIRRRIKAGRLAAMKVKSENGPAWRIQPDGVGAPAPPTPAEGALST